MDSEWAKFVDSVLSGVEPDETARRALREKLRGCTKTLYSMWVSGADLTEVGKQLSEQAREAR